MIPSPWVAVILTLGTFRLLRLIGWDDFPPILKARGWLIGEHWVPTLVPKFDQESLHHSPPELPGKQPSSEVDEVRPGYDRPLLAHLIHCPFCIGWWLSLAVYLLWLWLPTEVLYAAAPFALSGAIGLIAKNWDE